ncbi:MAG: TolB family protein, partial [Vicinamibacterales bacterium]
MDTRGRLTTLPVAPAAYSSPRLSPDGSKIAVSIGGDQPRSDIWIVDTVRGTRLRLTSEGGRFPAWSSDGRTVTFTTYGRTGGGLARTPADGSGAAVRLAESPSIQQVPVPSSGGKTMVFARLVAVSGRFQS